MPRIVVVAVGLLQFSAPSMAQLASDPANKASDAVAASESSASGLAEIIVTARRRAEKAQSVPITVDVLGPGDFSRAGSFGADQLAQASPALHADAQTGDRNSIVYTIRGQGQTYGTEYPSVIAYFAEVPVAHINTGQYFDLENVQVLKGPQGTLFGRVTDGGAVLIQPKAPTDKFEGFAEVKAGSYDLKGFTGAINAPLIADGVLSVRLAVDINRRKGFTIDSGSGAPGPIPAPGNPGNAGKDEDNVHYDSFRLSVSARPIEGLRNNTVFSFYKANENGTGVILSDVNVPVLSAVLGSVLGPVLGPFEAQAVAANAQANVAAGVRHSDLSALSVSQRTTKIASNITTYDINDNLMLKNVLGYVNIKEASTADFDGSPFALIDSNQAPFTAYWTEQISEEIQLQGSSFDQNLKWNAGLYTDYLHPGGDNRNLTTQLFFITRDIRVADTDRSYAAFGQGTYDLSSVAQGLSITGGLRYTEQKNSSTTRQPLEFAFPPAFGVPPFVLCGVATGPGGPTAGAPPLCENSYNASEHALTWTGALDYQLTPDTLLYVTSRRGFKGGGFNSSFSLTNQAKYNPEFIRDVELGLKSSWTAGGIPVRTNVALFRADETDIQRLVIFVVNGNALTYVSNAAKAVVQGLEFEGTVVPVPGLTVTAKYAYTDAKYNRDNAAALCNPFAQSPSFCPLNPLQDTPRNTVGLDVHYHLPLPANVGAVSVGSNYYYVSAMALGDNVYPTQDPNPRHGIEPGHSLVNVDASWDNVFGSPVKVSLFGTNITNRVYRVGVDNLYPNFGTVSNIYGEPRMYGVALRYTF